MTLAIKAAFEDYYYDEDVVCLYNRFLRSANWDTLLKIHDASYCGLDEDQKDRLYTYMLSDDWKYLEKEEPEDLEETIVALQASVFDSMFHQYGTLRRKEKYPVKCLKKWGLPHNYVRLTFHKVHGGPQLIPKQTGAQRTVTQQVSERFIVGKQYRVDNLNNANEFVHMDLFSEQERREAKAKAKVFFLNQKEN